MFVDYYEVLQVAENATLEDLKLAFRKQAIKWHPDRNLGTDTTLQMQRINEAYLILKDLEARVKFNNEYQRYKAFKKDTTIFATVETKTHTEADGKEEENSGNSSYIFEDEVLKKWMMNARRQSVALAKQTIEDFRGMVKVGLKAGFEAAGHALMVQIIIGIILLAIFGLTQTCNR